MQITTNPLPTDLETIRCFLASTCYPMDLMLQASNQDVIFAIGSTTEPDRWTSRLQASWCAKHKMKNKDSPPDLSVQCVACVPYAEIQAANGSLSLNQMTRLRRCA